MNRWPHMVLPSAEDGDAQIDGDASPPAVFAQAQGQQPWLRDGLPPWHMWGNEFTFDFVGQGFGGAPTITQQLTKVAYRRPETWHWVFFAQLLVAPDPGGVQIAGIELDFDLTIGVGRTALTIPSFEHFEWVYGPPTSGAAARQRIMWSTAVVGPNRAFVAGGGLVPPAPVANLIDQIEAQDIQVVLRANDRGNFVGNNFTLVVKNFWAPKTHIRPDWFNTFPNVPPEKVYGGSEIEGR